MPIIQISKIQQRSGNLVDLPQLDNAQFGWAYDQNRLFIGRSGSNVTPQNIEVLTAYSNLSFSQVTGTNGSNISITSEQNGELLAYNSTTNAWVNAGGNAGGQINLGNVANVKISDGAIGYVLQTDGYGNLTWTPKTTVVANITTIRNTTPGNVIIMTVPNSTPYVNSAQVTIAGVTGTNASANTNANTILNSKVFYVKVANDYPTSGNITLYTDSALTTTANGAGLQTSNTGTATTAIINTGVAYAAGSNTSIQFNNGGIIDGSANLTISGSNLNLSGNFTVANVFANSGTVVAGALTGPLTTNAQPNVTSLGALINLSVTGYANIGNIGTSGLITATGNINGGNLNVAGAVLTNGGNATTSALIITTNNANGGAGYAGIMQIVNTTGGATNPNKFVRLDTTGNLQIINSGYSSTLFNLTDSGALTILGNVNSANINITGVFANTLSVTGNANVGNLNTTGVFATTLSATGNANIGNIGTVDITTTGNIYINGNTNSTGGLGTASGGALQVAGGVSVQKDLNIAGNTTTANVLTRNITFANASIGASGAISWTVGTKLYSTSSDTRLEVSGSAGSNLNHGSNNYVGVNASGAFVKTNNANIWNFYANGSLSGPSNVLSVIGNVSAGTTLIGNVLSNNISTGANTIAGTITGNWTLTAGSRWNATYADLAEYYESDKDYQAGTVLEFGGNKEVTLASDETIKVAGVVSSAPAYVLNSTCPGEFIALIALQGRVPVKVRGNVTKGDMMVSAGNGFARTSYDPKMGTIIGKSLENFNGIEGIIEIAIGRL